MLDGFRGFLFVGLHGAVDIVIKVPDVLVEFVQVRNQFLQHPALDGCQHAVEVVDDLLLGRFQHRRNLPGHEQFVVLLRCQRPTADDEVQKITRAHAVDVGDRAGQLDVRAFQHLLQAVQLAGSVLNQALAIPNQFPQLTLVLGRYVARLQQPVLEQVRNPLGIFDVCLSPRYRLHMMCIDHHGVQP